MPGSSRDERVRIACVANFSPRKLGTGETRFVTLARALAERGHSFTLFGRDPVHPLVAEQLAQAGATWERLKDLGARPGASVRRLARDFDVIQLNLIAPRGRVAMLAYAAWPARVLFVDHVSGAPGPEPPSRGIPHRIADRLTMMRVHQVAGVSNYVRDRAARRFGLPADRTITVYGGVDVDRFRPGPPPESERSERAEAPVITTVAALIPEKGVDVLIRALASIEGRDWRLRIVGEGPARPALEHETARLGIQDRVEFLGLRDDVDAILRDSDIFVHPAVWQEALGYTVLEGMATELPVVASAVGGIPELIRNGEHGLLVPPGDPERLAASLDRLMNDPGLCARLGTAARERVIRRFSAERNIRRTVAWFEAAARGDLLDESDGAGPEPQA